MQNVIAAEKGLTLQADGSLTVFNDAIKTVFKFFVVDNWLYSAVLVACVVLALVIFKKCDKAQASIEERSPVGPMEMILQRISLEVGKSCTNTIWGLVLAVAIMLTPTLIRASTDEKTQAIVNVLGFVPGVFIGLIQLYSAYKIIEFVLAKLSAGVAVAAGANSSSQKN